MAFSLFGPNVDPVKKRLDDPYSAKFEDVKTLANGAVCGDFNAKNQYGAYSGAKKFAIVGGTAYLEGNAAEENTIIAFCVEGKDCKDHACADAIRAERQEKEDLLKLQRAVTALRDHTRGLCVGYIHTDEAKFKECDAAYRQCEKLDLLSEGKCYESMVPKYR